MELSGKVALVTGSSRGIGREISRVLAAKGARVAVHYRADREAAQKTLASLGGGPHAVFGADVAEAGSARGLVEGVAREMGGIDVLVNNAAVLRPTPYRRSTTGVGKTPGPGRSRRTSLVRRTCPSWPPG